MAAVQLTARPVSAGARRGGSRGITVPLDFETYRALGINTKRERDCKRRLEAIANQPDTVARVNGNLKRPERVLLLGLELTQPLVRVLRAPEGHRELVAFHC